jgi:hypothetical protein
MPVNDILAIEHARIVFFIMVFLTPPDGPASRAAHLFYK